MSEFAFNTRGPSDSVFKVPTLPSRYRKATYNNTQSTYNNEGVLHSLESTYNVFKKVEERYEVLKKICPPEDVTKILNDTVDRLTEVCYEKMAEQLVRPSHSQTSSVGGRSVYSVNTRRGGLAPSNYGTSILNNIQDQPSESSRRRVNSTASTKNHYGLLNAPIPDRSSNFPSCDQFSRTNDVIHEVEPVVKPITNKTIRSKKTPVITNDHVEKEDPAAGLSIPLRSEKPNPPLSQPKRPSKKQSPGVKELEVIPSEDESDSLSVFFGKGRKAAAKRTSNSRTNQNNQSQRVIKTRDVSVTIDRFQGSMASEFEAGPSRKRQATEHDDVSTRKKSPVAVEKETRPSPDTTSNIEKKLVTADANEAIRRSKRNTSVVIARKESALKVKDKDNNKENKEKPKTVLVKSKSRKEIKNPKANTVPASIKAAESNTNDGAEAFDDGSFFGDVSSIVGSASLVLTNTIAKNTTKHSTEVRNEMPSHFFSPFVNIRSTSGVSAISTPLSKTMTKNVLGKRLKKPSVVAELKNKQKRKPRKANALKTAAVVAMHENGAESSESDEFEVSDFSD